MKYRLLVLSLVTLFTTSCGSTDPVTPETPEEPTPVEPDIPDVPVPGEDDYVYPVRHGQDTPILHCFNWSLSNIESKLDDIKEAGFKTIQLSPLQPQKDPYNGNWKNQWWKLYQPFGFSVSKSTSENILGSKDDLISLCSKAKEKDIDVIVDVVANHLGGGSSQSLNSKIKDFEPTIYNNNLIHTNNKKIDDNNVEALVRGYMGDFPDLMTEDSRVSSRVLSLLKEYLDCGIKGFRFDAAKHIETEHDGEYASNFWSTILNGASQYAIAKGYDTPYYYGELLYTVGKNRQLDWYTSYMSLTDNEHGNKVRVAMETNNISKVNPTYYVNNDKAVLWAESHDTYSNDEQESTSTPIKDINKAYVIEASRAKVSTLYLSRPQGNLGDIGDLSYESSVVRAINNFHNVCADLDESVSTSNGYFINQRNRYGAVIVNVSGNETATVDLNNLKDGKYINLINNSEVNVTGGKANISFIDDTCILLHETFAKLLTDKPVVNIAPYSEVFSGAQTITLNTLNVDTLRYKVNDGAFQPITNNQIVFDSFSNRGVMNIVIEASNSLATITKEFRLIQTSEANKSHIFINVDTNYSNMIWHWQGFNQGSWANVSMDGSIMGYDNGSNDRFTIVKFPVGTTKDTANWDNALYQTNDLNIPSEKVIDYSTLTFKTH